MQFINAIHSDIGIKKKINQDSVVYKEAQYKHDAIVLAAICDGMGGMAKGEVASAMLVRALGEWFDRRMPEIVKRPEASRRKALSRDIADLFNKIDRKIYQYSRRFDDICGTTATGILFIGNRFYYANVGDSRIYRFDKKLIRITKDQSYVQREIDRGNLTEEEAERHPKRNILLQCVGAGEGVEAEFGCGTCDCDEVFLLCSDGLRHKVSHDEMSAFFYPHAMHTAEDLKESIVTCTEIVKKRGETDNITSILIKSYEEESAITGPLS